MQLGSLSGVTGDLRPYVGCTVLMSGESKLAVRFAHRSLQFFTYDRRRGVSYVGHNRVIMSYGSFVTLKTHSQLAMETSPWSYGTEQMFAVVKCTVHLVLINMRWLGRWR